MSPNRVPPTCCVLMSHGAPGPCIGVSPGCVPSPHTEGGAAPERDPALSSVCAAPSVPLFAH